MNIVGNEQKDISMKIYWQQTWFNLKAQKQDWKLFLWFFLYSLIPSLWILFRTYIITNYLQASLTTYSYWEYLSIILEIVQETLIFPLFWFVGKVNLQSNQEMNKAKQIYLISGLTYGAAIIIVSFFVADLLDLLASSDYQGEMAFFELQLYSKIFTFLTLISNVYLLNLKLYQSFACLLVMNLLLTIVFDFTFGNPNVFKNGYIGLGLSSLLSQIIIFAFSLILIAKQFKFSRFFSLKNWQWQKWDFNQKFFSNLIASFCFSAINNFFYLFIISKNLNFLHNSDVYWLSNTVIWSWVLLMTNTLINLEKSLISTSSDLDPKKTRFIILEFQLLLLVSFLVFASCFYLIYQDFANFLSNHNQRMVTQSFGIFQKMIWFFIFYVSTQGLMAYFNALGKNWSLAVHALLTNLIANLPFIILLATNQIQLSLDLIAWIFSLTQVVCWLLILVFFYFNLKRPNNETYITNI